MAQMAPSGNREPKNGWWVIIVILIGMGIVGATLYYKTPFYKTERKVASKEAAAKAVDNAVSIVCEEAEALRLENAALKERLSKLEPTSPPTAPVKPRAKVTVKQPTSIPKAPTKAANEQIPQVQPWSNTRVPDPVVKWLQHN